MTTWRAGEARGVVVGVEGRDEHVELRTATCWPIAPPPTAVTVKCVTAPPTTLNALLPLTAAAGRGDVKLPVFVIVTVWCEHTGGKRRW